ncbi:nucleotidyltransferase domain-containing protein [Mesobacillus zeae]|uniref:Nucleotidyltransferase domain-containing protein n=1 Tax=Mesobacillus zeae TaxID=1917180 RepID=A0A398BDP5_9BACI|nr:nucleotidyltransferase domain-containing protein [Mesobacillus zeae]RID85870.1 nucleotidyltransferase domain-containing protein [Mesobacillus zeae]
MRLDAIEAARLFVATYFLDCDAAILSGSVVRGEHNDTSDLDIVVIDENIKEAYRESLVKFSWPIELFVHSSSSCQVFFARDVKRARPTLPRMVAEGEILKGIEAVEPIRKQAAKILQEGPEPWDEETLSLKKYFLTDILDDFIGTARREEAIFIAGTLAERLQEFILRTNCHWIGEGKWIYREMAHFNKALAMKFAHAFDLFYEKGEKQSVIELAEEALSPHGGRLFEGFCRGKKESY